MLPESRIQELYRSCMEGSDRITVQAALRTAAREAAAQENEACARAAGGNFTYAGPDPEGAKNLQRLIVYVIRARREGL